jgi:hypothetical protein
LDSESAILNPGSWIQNPGFRVLCSKSWILDPESRMQNPGIRILDSESRTQNSWFWILDSGLRKPVLGTYLRIAPDFLRLRCINGTRILSGAGGWVMIKWTVRMETIMKRSNQYPEPISGTYIRNLRPCI